METKNKVVFFETIENTLDKINNRAKWDGSDKSEWGSLDELLQDGILWKAIEPKTIVPKNALYCFTKSITDKEVRLAVMKFLHEYARYYFEDAARDIVNSEYTENGWTPSEGNLVDGANKLMGDFQSELATQISQIEKTGLFSGEKFDKLQKRNTQLEEQVKELQNTIKALSIRLDRYEHPFQHQLFIPSELHTEEFRFIMNYLSHNQIVTEVYGEDKFGRKLIACYTWHGPKGLFGYFADRVSFQLEIYKDKRIQWKLFRTAFSNFKDVEKQAKDVVSAYKSWVDPQAQLPQNAEIIDEAIRYAEKEMEKRRKGADDSSRQVMINRV